MRQCQVVEQYRAVEEQPDLTNLLCDELFEALNAQYMESMTLEHLIEYGGHGSMDICTMLTDARCMLQMHVWHVDIIARNMCWFLDL